MPGLVIDEWPHTGNFKVRLGDISTLNYWSYLVYRVGVTNPQDVVIALLIDVDDDGSWDDFLIGEPYHYETGNGSGYTPWYDSWTRIDALDEDFLFRDNASSPDQLPGTPVLRRGLCGEGETYEERCLSVHEDPTSIKSHS